jgi:class 3 adenylate cyclase
MLKAKQSGRPLLIPERGWGLASEYPLSKGPITVIGRDDRAHVAIPDTPELRQVSREHAVIRLSGDNYVLEHRSKHNPTRIIRRDLNQPFSVSRIILTKKGEQAALRFDDLIEVAGAVQLRFVSDHAALGTQKTLGQNELRAVLNADCVGYSALVAENTDMTHQRIVDCYREIFRREYLSRHGSHHRNCIERSGDGVQALFPTATEAVSYAKAVQHSLVKFNSHLPVSQQLHFRIGCDLGEVKIDEVAEPGEIVTGEAVNRAERIQKRAEPGGVLISHMVYELLDRPTRGEFRRVGTLENVGRIVEVYQLIRTNPDS